MKKCFVMAMMVLSLGSIWATEPVVGPNLNVPCDHTSTAGRTGETVTITVEDTTQGTTGISQ